VDAFVSARAERGHHEVQMEDVRKKEKEREKEREEIYGSLAAWHERWYEIVVVRRRGRWDMVDESKSFEGDGENLYRLVKCSHGIEARQSNSSLQ